MVQAFQVLQYFFFSWAASLFFFDLLRGEDQIAEKSC